MSLADQHADLIAEHPIDRDVAVIDVGSNSIRLVHFRLEGRALWPIYNEKVMAGLGAGVRETGRLNPAGVDVALRALRRFRRLLDSKRVSDRHVVATAAVRNAEDGPAFVEAVAEQAGLDVRVLSGAQEGEVSAAGLLAGIPDAHGMTGDLGGSSLELTPLEQGQAGKGATYELGPQAVIGDGWDARTARERINRVLEKVDFSGMKGETFYAVGGAWRTLAMLAFAQFDYPLRVVHQFSLDKARVRKLTRLVSTLSPASLEGTPGVSRRRVATLPYAALLLRRIVKRGGFDHVVFSSYGLREGAIFQELPSALRDLDPLVAGAEALGRQTTPSPDFTRALSSWVGRFTDTIPGVLPPRRTYLLREAAVRLVDIGARLHPDHRLDLSRDTVLYAPFAGVDHVERAALAAVTHYRYGGSRAAIEDAGIFSHMSTELQDAAQLLGMTLRLAAKLSGRSERLLEHFDLEMSADELVLKVDESVRDLYVERSVSLLDNIAVLLNRRGRVEYG